MSYVADYSLLSSVLVCTATSSLMYKIHIGDFALISRCLLTTAIESMTAAFDSYLVYAELGDDGHILLKNRKSSLLETLCDSKRAQVFGSGEASGRLGWCLRRNLVFGTRNVPPGGNTSRGSSFNSLTILCTCQ